MGSGDFAGFVRARDCVAGASAFRPAVWRAASDCRCDTGAACRFTAPAPTSGEVVGAALFATDGRALSAAGAGLRASAILARTRQRLNTIKPDRTVIAATAAPTPVFGFSRHTSCSLRCHI